MLTEAKIILPLFDNDGVSTEAARNIIASDLLDAFGGYSEAASRGAWKSPEGKTYRDDSLTLTVAAEWNDARRYALRCIAEKAADEMAQECIYMSVNGEVSFVSPSPVAFAA